MLVFLPAVSNAGKPPNHGLPMTHVPYHYSTILFELAVLTGLMSEVVRRSVWYERFKKTQGKGSANGVVRPEQERSDIFAGGSQRQQTTYDGARA